MGSNNSGRGVGGSMVHYAGYTPRFHPSDFSTSTTDGVGADWPLSYSELRRYYEAIEQELPNPALTIMAVAARAADQLASGSTPS